MKPIKLIIKGVNSFKEEQVIDFNKLTNKGLFGIFGATGSGKSSLLDGITLALYSKTARDSADFINAKEETASIRYEFQIREKTIKHYIIDRSFKRNDKGGINAKKPTRIIELIDGEEVILEDAPTKVDKKCIEIIGLKFEDFIRTVVLPQGKFSEFLKLEGTGKRDMLERLFSLSQYGDNLSRKLSSVIRSEKSEMDKIEGQLKAYETISPEAIEEKQKAFEELIKLEEENSKALAQMLQSFLEYEKLWQLQKEQQSYTEQLLCLEKDLSKIEDYKKQAEKGENALKVKPYIDALKNTLAEIKQIEQSLVLQQESFKTIKLNKEASEEKFEKIKQQKEAKIPELKVIQNNLLQALEEEAQKLVLEEERAQLLSLYKEKQAKKNALQEELEAHKRYIADQETLLEESQKKLNALKVNPEYRAKIQKGVLLQTQKENLQVSKGNLEKNKTALQKEIEEMYQAYVLEGKALESLRQTLKQEEDSLTELIDKCPGDASHLLEQQQALSQLISTAEKGAKAKQKLELLAKQLQQYQEDLKIQEEALANYLKQIAELKLKIETTSQENMIQLLRSKLEENMPCPVCGAKEHYHFKAHLEVGNTNDLQQDDKDEIALEQSKQVEQTGESAQLEHIEHLGELEQLEQIEHLEQLAQLENLEKLEQKKKEVENSLLIFKTQQASDLEKYQEAKEELEQLGSEWLDKDIAKEQAKFEALKELIHAWTKEKEQKEASITMQRQSLSEKENKYIKLESTWEENKKALAKYQDEFQNLEASYQKLENDYNLLSTETQIKNFIEEDKNLNQADSQKEALEKQIETMRSEIKQIENKSEAGKTLIEKLIEELATIKTQGEAKRAQLEEKNKSILQKAAGHTDIKAYQQEVQKEIDAISSSFDALEKDKNKLEEAYQEISKQLEVSKSQNEALTKRVLGDETLLEKALKEQNFENQEAALSALKTQQEINQLKEAINNYDIQRQQLEGKMQEVKQKINGRELKEEDWDLIKEDKQNKEEALKVLSSQRIKLDLELKEAKKKLDEQQQIHKVQKALEHKLSLLKDLEGLFKGKRFVEFVAMHQLRYIAMEASKRLKEITSEGYGLELDENGKFIIRDYKNGGATRDASTLSGGETFLVSLALALALSAQIQLKGTAPLELFFLDEGFGTLDDNLLDVVMNSLEKLHHEHLSVGIISHVESIKNRVPVKLILTPAQAGIGGSKVRLERS